MSITQSGAPRITPFLWFNGNADEAVTLYCSVFPNSRRLSEFRSPVDTPSAPAGSLLTVSFELDGQRLTAMNGGPGFPFTQAVSFSVSCSSQEEIDHYWTRLTADGGQEIQCGWLKDRFGFSWQVVPANIMELLRPPAAMQRMMGMTKLNIAELQAAAQG